MSLTYLAGNKLYTMENELDLQRVNQVCLPEWYSRINSVVLRPQQPEYAIHMDVPPNENWNRVLRRLQQVKLCADVQIDSHPGTELLPLCQYLDRIWIHGVRDTYLKGALKFTAAILYDQECSGTVRNLEEQCLDNAEKAKEHCFQGKKNALIGFVKRLKSSNPFSNTCCL